MYTTPTAIILLAFKIRHTVKYRLAKEQPSTINYSLYNGTFVIILPKIVASDLTLIGQEEMTNLESGSNQDIGLEITGYSLGNYRLKSGNLTRSSQSPRLGHQITMSVDKTSVCRYKLRVILRSASGPEQTLFPA